VRCSSFCGRKRGVPLQRAARMAASVRCYEGLLHRMVNGARARREDEESPASKPGLARRSLLIGLRKCFNDALVWLLGSVTSLSAHAREQKRIYASPTAENNGILYHGVYYVRSR
jgi:hypothetical protein